MWITGWVSNKTLIIVTKNCENQQEVQCLFKQSHE